jgi:hypothetical protein
MVNWNDTLGYTTVKLVKVKDWRLGTLHYAFELCIFVFVILFAIFYKKGFMVTEQITGGSVGIRVHAPLNQSASDAYCCSYDEEECRNGTLYTSGQHQLPCLNWDELMTEWPIATGHELHLTTMVTIREEHLLPGRGAACDNISQTWRGANCKFDTKHTTKQDNYISNLEDFTVHIRHGAFTQSLTNYRGKDNNRGGRNAGALALNGSLVDSSGSITQKFFTKDREGDNITVRQLLAAANYLLDDDWVPNSVNGRAGGVNILFNIEYKMTGVLGQKLEYVYKLQNLSDLEYRVEQIVSLEGNSATRTVFDRHGIRFIVNQSGLIGRFDFVSTLITLVTGIGLLAVATTITDLLMQYVVKEKATYKAFKREVKSMKGSRGSSVQFRDVDNDDADDTQLLERGFI